MGATLGRIVILTGVLKTLMGGLAEILPVKLSQIVLKVEIECRHLKLTFCMYIVIR